MTDFEKAVLAALSAILRALAFLLNPVHDRAKQKELADYLTAYSGYLSDVVKTGTYPQDDEGDDA